MAKYYNNIKKTGRVGGSVFSIRAGETIERAYNPVVYNPNTNAQVSARARLKLMSQIAAVLGSSIAIPKEGAKSSRNLFIAQNYSLATYANSEATVPVTSLQLTKSNVAFPAIGTQRTSTNTVAAYISNADQVGAIAVNRIVYVLIARDTDGRMRYVDSRVATEPGEDRSWQVNFGNVTGQAYILAYGVRDNTEAARVIFGNLNVPTAEAIAHLIVTRSLMEIDVTLTETRGVAVTQAQG